MAAAAIHSTAISFYTMNENKCYHVQFHLQASAGFEGDACLKHVFSTVITQTVQTYSIRTLVE